MTTLLFHVEMAPYGVKHAKTMAEIHAPKKMLETDYKKCIHAIEKYTAEYLLAAKFKKTKLMDTYCYLLMLKLEEKKIYEEALKTYIPE